MIVAKHKVRTFRFINYKKVGTQIISGICFWLICIFPKQFKCYACNSNFFVRRASNYCYELCNRAARHSCCSYCFRKVQTHFAAGVEHAYSQDQANVYFTAMLLYSVRNEESETIENVAFKFIDERSFIQALTKSVEGAVRAFVATKKQSEILLLRTEIVLHVKEQLDIQLESWGFHLLDLQINDITFDEDILKSMSRVVASNNLKAAAENEGQALLITKTKAAEAEGNAIKISADAERTAAQMRGQGVALFREEVARGMAHAAKEMETANLDASYILFSMWTDAIKHFAEYGKGNTIFLDGSSNNYQRTMQQLMATLQGFDGEKNDDKK